MRKTMQYMLSTALALGFVLSIGAATAEEKLNTDYTVALVQMNSDFESTDAANVEAVKSIAEFQTVKRHPMFHRQRNQVTFAADDMNRNGLVGSAYRHERPGWRIS